MTVVAGFVAGLLAGAVLLVAGRGLLASPVLLRENHRGATLPTAGGVLAIAAVLAVEAMWTLVDVVRGDSTALLSRRLCLLATLGFGVLGLLDDVLGSGGDGRGFRGHLTAMRRGRLTTGGLKLLGGTAIALVIASSGPGDGVVQVLIDALVIALAANLANLLDRAPGRVLKAGAAAGVVLGVLTALDPGLAGLAVALGALLALLWADLRENLMIGDTGANVLGAALGVGLVLTAPVGARAGALAVLVVLNLLSEVVSFSSVIDRVPPLRWLDRAGRATA